MSRAGNKPTPKIAPIAATVQVETVGSYATYWPSQDPSLVWPDPFGLPPWLAAWWAVFARGWTPYLLSIRVDGRLAGLAPLMRLNREVRMMGDQDLCDHIDFVVAPDHARVFYRGLLDHLAADGINRLILWSVRKDASAMAELPPTAAEWGAKVQYEPRGQLFAMPLPATWEAYLQRLSGKERHEIRRKLRRLESAGRIGLRCVRTPAAMPAAMDAFMALFRANRPDKSAFMTGPRPAFFRRMAANMAAAGLLRLYFLELDEQAIAVTLCIDHNDTVYLYNNGYDDAYRALSVGLLCKVLTIRESISAGRRVYDFLKGEERYKRRLGGAPVDLYRCQIEWDRKRTIT